MSTKTIETVTHYQEQSPCRSAAQMEQLCCEKTAALQCCEKVEKNWQGYSADEIRDHLGLELDSQGRDSQGRYVNIQLVPRSQPCGEKVTKYDLTQKNCCGGVPALAWDDEVTPDVLPHSSSIIIAWTGSDGRQVEVSTTSNGTHFSDGRKTAIGHGDSIELFAGPTFCGCTAVTVRDGCSSATVVIRSDLGQWVLAGYGCQLSGHNGEFTGNDGNGQRVVEAISGGIKQIDYQVQRSSFNPPYTSGYFGGLFYTDAGWDAVCPGVNQAVCTPNEDTMTQHCKCANAAGFPLTDQPTCLAANTDGISIEHQCSPGVWLGRPGAIAINCVMPGHTVEGGVWGHDLHWLGAGTPPIYYKWMC